MAKHHQEEEHKLASEAYAELLCGGDRKAYLSIRPPWISTLISAGLTAHDRDDRIEREKACLTRVRRLSPFSTDDELWDWLLRNNPVPIFGTHEQLRGLIVERFGWEKWTEDPWGNQVIFDDWLHDFLTSIHKMPHILRYFHEQCLVWAINETQGRCYFAEGIARSTDARAISTYSNEYLWNLYSEGLEQWTGVKKYTGQRKFGYPDRPLPADFMILQIVMRHGAFSPYSLYLDAVGKPYLGYTALKELTNRLVNHPESRAFFKYLSATDGQIQKWAREIQAPESYEPSTMDEAFEDMETAMKGPLLQMVQQYMKMVDMDSVTDTDGISDGYPEALESLYKRLNESIKEDQCEEPFAGAQLEKDILAAINGELGYVLKSAIKHDIIDETRKNEPPAKKLARLLAMDKQNALEYLACEIDMQAGNRSMAIMDNSLEDLNLNLSELTPTELMVFNEVYTAIEQGFEFDSKKGESFRQYWGNDYEKKMRAWRRAKDKLNTK